VWKNSLSTNSVAAGLMPIIIATWEAKAERVLFPNQSPGERGKFARLLQPITGYHDTHLSSQDTRGEIKRITFPGQPMPKSFERLHLNGKKLNMVACSCHSSYDRKPKIGESWYRMAWAKSETLSPI
jgi:hypothetical protein